MTVSCARCHDHKFDAISTADYYSLTGYLQSSNYRQVRFESLEQNKRVAEQLLVVDRKYQQQIAELLLSKGISPPAQTSYLNHEAVVLTLPRFRNRITSRMATFLARALAEPVGLILKPMAPANSQSSECRILLTRPTIRSGTGWNQSRWGRFKTRTSFQSSIEVGAH